MNKELLGDGKATQTMAVNFIKEIESSLKELREEYQNTDLYKECEMIISIVRGKSGNGKKWCEEREIEYSLRPIMTHLKSTTLLLLEDYEKRLERQINRYEDCKKKGVTCENAINAKSTFYAKKGQSNGYYPIEKLTYDKERGNWQRYVEKVDENGKRIWRKIETMDESQVRYLFEHNAYKIGFEEMCDNNNYNLK